MVDFRVPAHVPPEFRIEETTLSGVFVGTPSLRPDVRGWFIRVFDDTEWPTVEYGERRWVQENQLRSRQGTIRGLHFQKGLAEAKLLRVVRGEIFDVVVDLRPTSSTFLQWESFILDDRRHEQLLIPPGCAHGFQALSTSVDLCIKTSTFYEEGLDAGVLWSDDELGIPWPLPNPILSPRDMAAPPLNAVRELFDEWFE
ncbi:MAG: dTDP-4-dehydrorhamnose 3,5-epimerase family protein [Solirubrobacterales bacterium]